MAHPLGPPPHPLAGRHARTLPRARPGLPAYLSAAQPRVASAGGSLDAGAGSWASPLPWAAPSTWAASGESRAAALSAALSPSCREVVIVAGRGARASWEARRVRSSFSGGGKLVGCRGVCVWSGSAARAPCRCGGLAARAPATAPQQRGRAVCEAAGEGRGRRSGGWGEGRSGRWVGARASGRGARGAGRARAGRASGGRAPTARSGDAGLAPRAPAPAPQLRAACSPGRHRRLSRWAPERRAELGSGRAQRRWRQARSRAGAPAGICRGRGPGSADSQTLSSILSALRSPKLVAGPP